LLLAAGKIPEARNHAEIVLQSEPQNAQAQTIISRADATQGDLAKAVTEAQAAVQMDPKRAETFLNLAVIQEKSKDLNGAEQSYLKAVSLNPQSLPALLSLGTFYQRQKRWPDAEKQFQAAIAVDPKSASPRASLAGLYLNEGKPDAAEKTLQDAKSALSENPAGYRMLAELYLGQKQWDKALAELGSLYSEHPKDSIVGKMYAEVLLQQNRLDDASKVTDTLLKNTPSDPGALTLQGEILIRQGKATDAVHVLEQVVKNSPDNAAAHFHLGMAYAATQNMGQAESEWRQASKLQPGMVEPLRTLAALAMRRGDESLLEETGGKLMMLEPRSPEGYILHGEALLMKKDQAGGEADLKRAIGVARRAGHADLDLGVRLAGVVDEQHDRLVLGFVQRHQVEPVGNLDVGVAQPFRQRVQGGGVDEVTALDRHDLVLGNRRHRDQASARDPALLALDRLGRDVAGNEHR